MRKQKDKYAIDLESYRAPFPKESLAEWYFVRELKNGKLNLLIIGRQVDVYMGPERLDVLAIDAAGMPWVFELKRDVAKPEAISQLLVYGSYVAALSHKDLDKIFQEKQRAKTKTSLAEAFRQRFGKDLPPLTHQVCLMIGAFDFSYTCVRALKFLKRTTQLEIGQFKIQWSLQINSGHNSPLSGDDRRKVVASLKSGYTTQVRFDYLAWPQPSRPMELTPLEASTSRNLLLSTQVNCNELNWKYCQDKHLMVIPDLEQKCNLGIFNPDYVNAEGNYYGDLPSSLAADALKPGIGLFVHAQVVGDLPDRDADDPISGLLGFGVVQDRLHQASHEEIKSLTGVSPSKYELGEIPWLVGVDWIKTVDRLADAVQPEKPITFSEVNPYWLRPIDDWQEGEDYLQALGIKPRQLF